MTRSFWLIFSGKEGFRGACVVDVDEMDAAIAQADIAVRFPHHAPGAEWLAAATRKAWVCGCNPGGQVGLREVDPTHVVPRNRLFTEDELAHFAERQWVH